MYFFNVENATFYHFNKNLKFYFAQVHPSVFHSALVFPLHLVN